MTSRDNEPLITRDSARGIYIPETFIRDASELLNLSLPDGFDDARMGAAEGGDLDVLTDWVVELEGKLSDAGYEVDWTEGYSIYGEVPA